VPLAKSSLESSLQDLFTKPPFAEADVAQAWADAMNGYATAVTPPSTTVASAAASLATALTGFSVAGQAASKLEAAFTTFGGTVGGGMAPTYTGVGPLGQVGFATIFANPSASPSARAQDLADAIDTWMQTGKATLSAPPNTPFPPHGTWV
jgi:hypothetical protein